MGHHTYKINAEKPQKQEVVQKYPNLTAPVYINLATFQLAKDLGKATKGQIESIIKSKLNSMRRTEVSTDYEISKREKIVLVKDFTPSNPVFENKIKMPEHLVDN